MIRHLRAAGAEVSDVVGHNAAESLARLGAKQAIDPLLPLLEDENTMVQETVEGVLASLGWKQNPAT